MPKPHVFDDIPIDPKMIEKIDSECEHIDELLKSWTYYDKTVYRKCITAQKFKQGGNNFQGIFGEVLINASMADFLSLLISKETVNEKSPLQIQKSTIGQKIYFCSPEDKVRHDNLVAKKSAETFHFVTHNVSRSPVPMIVSHRDAVVMSVLKVLSPQKAFYYSIPHECKEELDGVVRAYCLKQYI